MCGRFGRDASWEQLREWYNLFSTNTSNLEPRYNIAPTQNVLIVGNTPKGNGASMAHWGLVPSWARDAKLASRMINARAETVAEKPAYRSAFERRRCIVPASGFFEWQKAPGGKQPWWIYSSMGELLSFAGLWEENETLGIRSCTILTRTATEFMRPLHDRMPLLLDRAEFEVWLDKDTPANDLQQMLHEDREGGLAAHPVSTRVNSPANDSAKNIEPLTVDEKAEGK